jgi:hypothetical protein
MTKVTMVVARQFSDAATVAGSQQAELDTVKIIF